MKATSVFAAVLLALLLPTEAFGQEFCGGGPGSEWCHDGPRHPSPECPGRDSFGDPVGVESRYSFHSVVDFSIDTPAGPFAFERFYTGSPQTWYSAFGPARGVPFPYFDYTNEGAGTWWHSLYSFIGGVERPWEGVDNTKPDAGFIRYMNGQSGNFHEFNSSTRTAPDACMPPSTCWWQRHAAGPYQVQAIPTGYRVIWPDGSERYFEAISSILTSPTYIQKRYLLSKIQADTGATLASVVYGAPNVSPACRYSAPGEYFGVPPYIREVILAGGHKLAFQYERTGVNSDCRLRQVQYLAPGSMTPVPLVTYGYESSGARRFVSATKSSSQVESYGYANEGFQVFTGASPLYSHATVADGGPTQLPFVHAIDTYGNQPAHEVVSYQWVIQNGAWPPITNAGGACFFAAGGYRSVGVSTTVRSVGGAGTSSDSATATMVTRIDMPAYTSPTLRRKRLRDETSCSGPACSPGEQRYEARGTSDAGLFFVNDAGAPIPIGCGGESVPSAFRDKRGSWEVNWNLALPMSGSDGGVLANDGGYDVLVRLATQRGLYEPNDAGVLAAPLLSEKFEYVVFPSGRFAVSKVTTPSSLTGTPVETKYYWDASGAGKVLTKIVTTGSRKNGVQTWATEQRNRAIFFRRDPADPLKRVTETEGPCWVHTDADPGCAEPNQPRTTYEYHALNAGANSARLSATTVYSGMATSRRIEYSDYTPEGDPGKVKDVGNDIETTYTYQGGLVTSQRVEDLSSNATAVTEWQYDNEKVRSIRYPEGNYEVFCYRTSAFPDCSGPQKAGLRWRAKVDGLTGFTLSSGWSERIEYSYNDAGDQVEERRYSVQEPSEPRLALRTNPDLHGRPTFTRAGNAGAANRHFSSRSHFDGADNRDAVAPAYVKAPSSPLHEYCLTSSGTPSPECWWFRYDRANRVNQATSPTTNLAKLSKACFDYSPAGNLTAVAVGSSNGLTCDTSFNQPGVSTGLTGADTAGLVYGWDDFGNVISVFNSGTDDPGTESRYVYDARGNVIERKTPGMGIYWHRLVYDRTDRLVELRREGGGGPVVLYQLEYDKSSTSPPQIVRHTDGKLARRIDSYGSTWYSYDSWGNVEAEFRLRNKCNWAKGVHCEPSTRYSWNRNGGIAWVWYPFGRLVTYGYGVGSLQDRVSSISVGVFASGGSQTSRTVLSDIAWEPYGSVRGYSLSTLAGQEQLALEYYKGVDGSPPEDCDAPPSGPTDGSGRSVALLVGQGPYSPNQSSPVPPSYFSQKIGWTGDQVTRTTTCLKGRTGSDFSVHRQTFDYDAMERMIREDMEGFPRIEGDGILEEKIFDVRGNREDETEDGYDNLQTYYSPVAKDRMTEQCWWRGLLNPNECLVSYNYTHGASGVLQTISGLQNRWTTDFTYSHTQALSDVYSSVGRGGAGSWVPLQMSYDAFNRRRYKANALGYGQEFYYGLEKDLLVDQAWSNAKVQTTLDEYIWLDGRPVMAIRGRVDVGGTHLVDAFESPDTSMKCSRPMDDGQVACGLFHLVTNLQSFPVLAISNSTGQVASFMLPDADGSVNSSRMMGAWGGQGIDLGFEFPLNERFRKQARFRASWTGANGPRTGVEAFFLDGANVLNPGGQELGQVWSAWSPVVDGTATVRWTVSCPTAQACSSAGDAFEWRAWEGGAEEFHTRLRFPGQYADAETDFYENWHRYYDPQNGRYLSPEPLLQSPTWVASRLRSSVQTPSYSYAANNPVYFVDPDGLDVTNGTGRTMWVKPEDSSEPVELPPGATFPGPQDGFTHPDRPGEVFKTVDNQDAQCGPNQKVSTAPNPAIRNQSVKTLKSNWGQSLKGGWKKADFAQKHPDWAPLFRKAGARP